MPKSPLPAALLAQVLGALLTLGLVYAAYRPLLNMPLPLMLLQGACAAFVAWRMGAPRWWCFIHLGFMPLVALMLALALPIAPTWYLAAFVVLLLLFWRTDQSRVPLYLSNRVTAEALLSLLPAESCRLLDAGCGTAGLLRILARARPDCQFVGIEHAPATYLWAKINSAPLPNLEVLYGSFWQHDFACYDRVYAFLSPVPMAELWLKSCAEMAPESLLVSNSFTIPEQACMQVVAVSDRRQTQLYCYKPQK